MLEYENQDDSLLFLSKLEQRIINLELNYEETDKTEYTSFTDVKKSKLKQLTESLKGIFKSDATTSSIKNNQIVKFHINSNEPKAVEILLQRMFNTEFDITDDNLN